VTASDWASTLPFVIPPVPACRGTEPRVSYYAAPPTTTYAAFIEESRMKFADPRSLTGNLGELEGPDPGRADPHHGAVERTGTYGPRAMRVPCVE
jgi:hypothetical protein